MKKERKIRKKGKAWKRIGALLLAVVLTFSCTASVSAAESSSPKEEVVYAMLNHDGAVNGIYVVNIFNGSHNIVDYGDYSAVRNMTTNDKISQNGDKITVTNTGDKLYYEGTLKEHSLPWNIAITYYLDGKAYSADDIAGKSGKLTIKMKITRNQDCNEEFYKDYALQTSFVLDTKKCSNIAADGATIANAGSNKQLSYTVLPDKGADITITADVKEFTMDAITINGIRLHLNIKVDDAELMKKVDELQDAVKTLDHGAKSINNGTSDLSGGRDKLVSGVNDLKNGSTSLDNGVNSLKSGIDQIQTGLNTLNSKSSSLDSGSEQVKSALIQIQSALSGVSMTADQITALVNASSSIKTAITSIYNGIDTLKANVGYAQYKAAMSSGGLDIDSLKENNTGAINSLNAQIASLTSSYNAIKDNTDASVQAQAAQLKSQIDQLTGVITLLTGNNAAIGGTETYLNNVSSAISQLDAGASELNSQYAVFDAKIVQLGQGLSSMITDMSKLSSAINTLVSQYTVLDNGIHSYTDAVAQIVSGYSGVVNGVNSLAAGSKSLADGSNTLYTGTTDLSKGVSELYGGTNKLKDGTSKFKKKTAHLDTDVTDQINDLVSKISGDTSIPISFVSSENTKVQSVQFVIKTSAIEVHKAAEPADKTAATLTLWQKFLALFGWKVN